MAEEITEISELQAKRLYLAAQKMKTETGIAIEEILLKIIYESDDDQARADAIRTFLAVMLNSHITLDSIMEEPNLAEVLSLNAD
jgi:hypothetical protein